MDKQEIIVELEASIGEYLTGCGLQLVELIYRYEGRGLFLRVLVDKPEGGITLGECASLNQEIGIMLDAKDAIKDNYILEVSSPGIDRSLFNKDDFNRCKNKKVKFFLKELIVGKLEWDGVINKIEGDSVFADINGQILEIPISKINKAKQIL